MREVAEILRFLRTTLEARSTLHPRTLGATMHLRTELRTILCEAAALLRAALSTTVVVLHPRALRAELRTILREALASLLRTKVVMVMVPHAWPARFILRKLLARLPPHRSVRMFTRSGLRPLILRALSRARLIPLRPRLPRLLRAIVLRLPLLTSALKALRHLVAALHLPSETFAHLAFKALPHLRLKLLATLHPRLRPAIAARLLRSLRRGARSAGLWPGALRLRIASIIATRRALAALVKRRPAISIATAVAPLAPITTRLIRTEVATPWRAHLAIAVTARLTGLTGLRLRLAGLLRRIAILRPPHGAPVELREKFIRRDAPIAAAIQLLQRLRRILHLLLIDHAIVIRIEQIEERRPHPSSIARATTSTLPIGARLAIRPLLRSAITSGRQALRCIRRLRWLRRSILRTEHRCRERHRDRGE